MADDDEFIPGSDEDEEEEEYFEKEEFDEELKNLKDEDIVDEDEEDEEDLLDLIPPPKKKKKKAPLKRRTGRKRKSTSMRDDDVSPPPKKKRKVGTGFSKKLLAYEKAELVEVIGKVLSIHPEVEQTITDNLPKPDLSKVRRELELLGNKIRSNLPYSRYRGTATNHYARNRVRSHISNFRVGFMKYMKMYKESKNWEILLQFLPIALDSIANLVSFDTEKDNKYITSFRKTVVVAYKQLVKARNNGLETSDYQSILNICKDQGSVFDEVKKLAESKM